MENMKPTHYATRTAAVLAMCETPRTLPEIRQAFSDDTVRAEYALRNLIKRNAIVNLNAHIKAGSRLPGLYQAADAVREPQKPRDAVQRSTFDTPRAVPSRRWDATDLIRAWSGVAG